MTISQKFTLLISIFTLVIISELFLITSINEDNAHLVEVGIPVMQKSNELKFNVIQVQQWLTDISATRGQDGLNDGFDEAKKSVENARRILAELIQLDPTHQQEYDALKAPLETYYQAGQTMAHAYVSGGPSKGNQFMATFDDAAATLTEKVAQILVSSNQKTDDLLTHQEDQLNTTITSVLIATLILGLVMTVIFFLGRSVLSTMPIISQEVKKLANGNMCDFSLNITRNDELGDLIADVNKMHAAQSMIIKEMLGTSEQLVQTVDHLSGISQQTQTRMQEQEDQVFQVASAIEQMSASSAEVASNTSSAAGNVQETNQLAQQGKQSVSNTLNTISNLVDEVEHTTGVIQQLGNDSDDIGSILDVIRGIAEQTNLLALNAAIEAARAGEQGRGFAVVADEVRTLAGRTQQSTQEIQEVISRLQASSTKAIETTDKSKGIAQQGAKHIEQASNIMNSIHGAMDTVTQTNHSIATATRKPLSIC